MHSRLSSVAAVLARGAALFLGGFVLIGIVGELRGRTSDVSLWLVDVRDLPAPVRIAMLAGCSAVLVSWAVSRSARPWHRRIAAAACVVLGLVAIRDSLRFWVLLADGQIRTLSPIPLSLVVAGGLVVLAVAIIAGETSPAVGRLRWWLPVVGSTAAWALVFPLAQMLFFGTTDYRRPADAAVVFGARVYADGRPSPLLADRVETAVALYRSGLVPMLVMSGGDGDDGWNEARVMRDEAVGDGVDPAAIVVDPVGTSTEATVANTVALLASSGQAPRTHVIAVSHAYHLPRVQLAFAAAGVDVLTVPAVDPVPIAQMPLLVAREIPAFWAYYLRDCLG